MYLKSLKIQLEHKELFHAAEIFPCEEYGTSVFFSQKIEEIEMAKSVCSLCGLSDRCFESAVDRRESAGVWGGHLFEDGYILSSKRKRGRPRKDEVLEKPIKLAEFYA
jgi:WhiB family redox-sensing transcriptional regulator